jgi:NAD dependent epimerase/dehydratase
MSWTGRRVLVTGADGFIGSHLTEALARAGARVRALCLYNSGGRLGCLEGSEVSETLDVRLGDLRDAPFITQVCRDVDVVFHLAALVSIPYSYAAPQSFVDTNVRGTLNVLDAVRHNGCTRLVHTSTSEVYGTPDTLPITEAHPLCGQSPYSASKIAADKLSEAYYCSFDVPVVTLRPFNTYGPRQSARAVIPTILSQLLAGRTTVRLGNLAPRRDLTYVADVVNAFLAAGNVSGIEGRVIQLGSGRDVSVFDIFEAACAACGVVATVEAEAERFRPARSEVMVLQSDPSLAAALLGWRATTSLDSGLRQTVAWIQKHAERFQPDVYAI